MYTRVFPKNESWDIITTNPLFGAVGFKNITEKILFEIEQYLGQHIQSFNVNLRPYETSLFDHKIIHSKWKTILAYI